jgi:hypothetical protein
MEALSHCKAYPGREFDGAVVFYPRKPIIVRPKETFTEALCPSTDKSIKGLQASPNERLDSRTSWAYQMEGSGATLLTSQPQTNLTHQFVNVL